MKRGRNDKRYKNKFVLPEEVWDFLGQQVSMHYPDGLKERPVFEESFLTQLVQDPEKGVGGVKGGTLVAAIRSQVAKGLVTWEAVKALEDRVWKTDDLQDDTLKWTIVLRWADDLFQASFYSEEKEAKKKPLIREQVLLQVATWLREQLVKTKVSAVPYGAQPYWGSKSEARTTFKGVVIELPNWDEEPEEGKREDNGDAIMQSGQTRSRHNFEEALDFLRLPFQVLESKVFQWDQQVKEQVLQAVVELRLYRLMQPFREQYLEFVDQLLGLGRGREPQVHRFHRVVDDYLVKDMSAEAAQQLKSSRFYGWLQGRVDKFLEKHYDRAERSFKGSATVEQFRREEEELTEKAPLKMLKLFGISDNLSSLLWQIEIRVRANVPEGNSQKYGNAGELRHLPPHVKILVNLACDVGITQEEEDARELWLKIVHRLLLVIHLPHIKAYKNLRSWCDRSRAVMDSASDVLPITGLEKKLELVPMYALVKEMTADSVCVPFEKEPLRIQKWGKEKSVLNTNEMAMQRACVLKLTKSGFVASKFERAATLLVTEDYARKHSALVERAKEDVEERKRFILNRKRPSQESLILNQKCQLISEVVKRWSNGKLPAPSKDWYGYLKTVRDLSEKKLESERVNFTQELKFGTPGKVIDNGEELERFKREVVEPVIERMLHKVRLERLKVFYMKWIYDNKDSIDVEFKKLHVPISQWLTQDKLKKLEVTWDKNKSEDQNKGEILWRLMYEERGVHLLKLGNEGPSMPKLQAIIEKPEDESWKTVDKRAEITEAMKEAQTILVYTKDLELVFGKIEDAQGESGDKRQKTH